MLTRQAVFVFGEKYSGSLYVGNLIDLFEAFGFDYEFNEIIDLEPDPLCYQ
jgi:hypothetical protein